jgi:hypothetical protein
VNTQKSNDALRRALAAEELSRFPPAQETRVFTYPECAVLSGTSLRTFERTMKYAPDRPPHIVISGNRKGVLSTDFYRFLESRRRFPPGSSEPPPKRPRGRPRKQTPTVAAEGWAVEDRERKKQRREAAQPRDNRADFDEAIITLADDTWSSERSTHVRTAKPTKPQAADRVFELLAEAIAIDGEVVPSNRHVPPDARGVRLDTWRRYCEAGCISEGDLDPVKKAAADRKAFWRASNHLLAARRVGMWREWVWIA